MASLKHRHLHAGRRTPWPFRLGLATLAWGVALLAAAEPRIGLQTGVVFDQYSPLSRNDEMAHRLLSPLAAEVVQRQLKASGQAMRDQPVDLSRERFILYLPAHGPPEGYGLMVFIPPWPDARLPAGWSSQLDQRGIIFVSAANIGNDDSVFGRREPLALIAAWNVASRYPLDPRRVYVAGFSGGSRVAMRLALAYPDLFRGAFLNAGADPAGSGINRLPPRSLLELAQAQTRLVFMTGAQDEASLSMDADANASMRQNCLFNLEARTMFGVGHEVAGADALARGLDLLQRPLGQDPEKLAACRAALQRALDQGLDKVRQDLAKGDRAGARKRIIALDTRFGGFAERRIADLADTCGCGVFAPSSRP